MIQRHTVFGLLAASAIAVGSLVSIARSRLAEAAESAAAADAVAAASAAHAHHVAGHAHAGATTTVESYLASHFGDRWPAVKMECGVGADLLAQAIDPASIPPWESVEAEFLADLAGGVGDEPDPRGSELSWGDPATSTAEVDFSAQAYNPSGKTIDAGDVARLREIVRPFDEELRALAVQRAVLRAESFKDAWTKGYCEKAPLVSLVPRHTREGKLCSLQFLAASNWNVAVGFIVGDSPAYDDTIEAIESARAARMRAVLEHVAQTD